jgi:hypothetical protein
METVVITRCMWCLYLVVSEGQLIRQTTAVVVQVETEWNVSLLAWNYLQNCHCDKLLPVPEKEELIIVNEIECY